MVGSVPLTVTVEVFEVAHCWGPTPVMETASECETARSVRDDGMLNFLDRGLRCRGDQHHAGQREERSDQGADDRAHASHVIAVRWKGMG